MRSTHTLATMAVSRPVFTEIQAKLLGAGYDHAVHTGLEDHADGMLDMTGIGLVVDDKGGASGEEIALALREQLTTDAAAPQPAGTGALEREADR